MKLMISDIIKNFPGQLKYRPEIKNAEALGTYYKFIIAGMGGSNLASGLLKIWKPELDLIVQRDYGLPATLDIKERLIICSSYSGNTEETIDAFNRAAEAELPVAVISTGGKLLDLAKESGVPYIQLPADTVAQPRLAMGLSLKAMLKLMGEETALSELETLADSLDSEKFEAESKDLAEKLADKVPAIYSSSRNKPLAYVWKVIINEGSKIPAFYNCFPEANHNEMIGFDVVSATKPLSEKFHFIFLRDEADEQRVLKRMELTKGVYGKRGFEVEVVDLKDGSVWEKIFGAFLTASWLAYYLAQNYGVEPEQVPMVEEFKKTMSGN